MQDVEFSVYASVYQAGRNHAGTAGMGGNGQFNRLSALDAIVEGDGPWRNRLTEDQDLGLRLLAAGWKSHQELRAVVEQQGVPRLRPLAAAAHALGAGQPAGVRPAPRDVALAVPAPARGSARSLYLLMPLWQTIVGCGAALRHHARGARARPDHALGRRCSPRCTCSGSRTPCSGASRHATRPAGAGWLRAIVVAHLYALYTWLLFPVLLRSIARQLGTRRDWARTDRVPLESAPTAR